MKSTSKKKKTTRKPIRNDVPGNTLSMPSRFPDSACLLKTGLKAGQSADEPGSCPIRAAEFFRVK